MNPQEMPNKQLLDAAEQFAYQVGLAEGQTFGPCEEHNELLRRLNEADALRKENEELREGVAELHRMLIAAKVGDAFLLAARLAKESEASK